MWRTNTYIATIFTSIVFASMLWANFEYRYGYEEGDNSAMTFSCYQGWPVPCRTFSLQETYNTVNGAIQERTISDTNYRPLGVLVDLIVFATIILSAVYTCNAQWHSSRKWKQFSLGNILFLLTFTAILSFVYVDEIWNVTAIAERLELEPHMFHTIGSHQWYVAIPLSFGVTCVAWTFVSFASRTTLRCLLGR